jgi:cobalt-zinc-cadmium efflux system protein
MKSEKNILIAFILNLCFSVFEFIGGIITGSVAIVSDAVHDIGDATSIGISFFLEKKSKRQPDEEYTYGYARYSVIGSVITTLILLLGSAAVIYNAILRIITPTEINYEGMIIFAFFGVCVNFLAAFFTREGDSLNQKAVNLHMLEDVLGWAVVLVGAIVMRFTDIKLIDPILSICVAVYIFIHAFSHLNEALDLFLVKTPEGIDIDEIKSELMKLDGVTDVHHIHVWSMDGNGNYATMHIVTDSDQTEIKRSVKEALHDRGIVHATLETETEQEKCTDEHCRVLNSCEDGHQHHHHHHH